MALSRLFIHILITDLLLDCLTQKKIGNVSFTSWYQFNFGNGGKSL